MEIALKVYGKTVKKMDAAKHEIPWKSDLISFKSISPAGDQFDMEELKRAFLNRFNLEGHKLLKVHNGDIYSLKVENENKNGVYKNNIKIGEVENVQPKVRNYTDPFCRTTANNELIINYYDVKNYILY